jgi:hypothetical protein
MTNQLETLFKEFLTSFTKSEYISSYFPVVELKNTLRTDKQNVMNAYDESIHKINEHIFDLEQL